MSLLDVLGRLPRKAAGGASAPVDRRQPVAVGRLLAPDHREVARLDRPCHGARLHAVPERHAIRWITWAAAGLNAHQNQAQRRPTVRARCRARSSRYPSGPRCRPCTALWYIAVRSHHDLMPSQLTVRLPDDLDRALKAATRRMQRGSSDIVRLALREFLGVASLQPGRSMDRVRGLIGSLESGVPDLAARHREYVLRSLTGRRASRGR